MIPAVIPPLTGLSVLVTRPQPQSDALANRIRCLGGDAIVLPAIDIRPLAASVAGSYELVVFVSVNAVDHGARLIVRSQTTRIAAIGKATAAALSAANVAVDIVPERGFTSETLLAHPELALEPGSRVLIVRGAGGRELLQETFAASGCAVDILDVYERLLPVIDEHRRTEIETLWAGGEINVVTATSVATLTNLTGLLSERGVEMLRNSPLVVPSPRVRQAATEMGLRGECIVAAGADDISIVGALSLWHARARAR